MSTDVDIFLAHYGVKGMKWGVRKADGPSRREVRTTAKYLRKGLDREAAEKKAKGRIAAENILLGVGATLVVAGAGYAAYRIGDRHFGSVNLPAGSKVHHVNVHGPNLEVQNKPMFVSFKRSDQKFYDSIFANFSRNRSRAENIYKSTLETTTDIKAPSNFEAARLYREFQKKHPELTDSYSTFNYSFNGEGAGSTRLKKAFQEHLQSKGYNAMIDNFDSVKSLRSRTQRPTILFDPTNSIKKVEDILLDNAKVSATAVKYEMANLASKAAFNPVTVGLGGLAGYSAYSNYRGTEGRQETRVDNYKRSHPNTKLSDAEIYNLVGYKR
jgi:hypothetical protein